MCVTVFHWKKKRVLLCEREALYRLKNSSANIKKREIEQNQALSKLSINSGKPRKLRENDDLQRGGNLSPNTQQWRKMNQRAWEQRAKGGDPERFFPMFHSGCLQT